MSLRLLLDMSLSASHIGRQDNVWNLSPLTLKSAMDYEIDYAMQTELEAAVFRRLIAHLRQHTEVQNIDLMNLAGFCRNCLGNWFAEAANERGLPLSRDDGREGADGQRWIG